LKSAGRRTAPGFRFAQVATYDEVGDGIQAGGFGRLDEAVHGRGDDGAARGLGPEVIPAPDHAREPSVFSAAHAAHPERFPAGVPTPLPAPIAVWINPPTLTSSDLEKAH